MPKQFLPTLALTRYPLPVPRPSETRRRDAPRQMMELSSLRATGALPTLAAAAAAVTPPVAAVTPLRHPLLYPSDVGIELRTVLGSERGTRVGMHALGERLELCPLVSRPRERGTGSSGVTALAGGTHGLEVRPHRLTNRLELTAVLLADGLEIRLLGLGQRDASKEAAHSAPAELPLLAGAAHLGSRTRLAIALRSLRLRDAGRARGNEQPHHHRTNLGHDASTSR
jgi:hypothetical protein